MTPGTAATADTKRLFGLPPLQWDREMARDKPARIHGPSDLGNLTGGILFGMQPQDVNRRLPNPLPKIEWASLASASEFPEDVRFFLVRLDSLRELATGVGSCMGATSHVVFLFRASGLFRMSWRLVSDAACPSPRAAAEDIFARFLAIDQSAALTTHYRPNRAEAVEVTDPAGGYLIPIRWENRQRR